MKQLVSTISSILIFTILGAIPPISGQETGPATTTDATDYRITSWGTWGPTTYCPVGTHVQGFQLRADGYLSVGDNTALNAIRLFCGDPDNSTTVSISSKEGPWGDWRTVYPCRKGHILGHVVGFYLRSYRSGQLFQDEMATTNFRVICRYPGDDGVDEIEGDHVVDYGSWYKARGECGSNMTLCGIQTQVQDRQGVNVDDTSLNNVDGVCCSL